MSRFTARKCNLQAVPVDEHVKALANDMFSDGEIRPEYDSMAARKAIVANHVDTTDQFLHA